MKIYKSHTVECRISKVILRDDGILYVKIKPEELFNLSDAEELVEAAKQLGKGEKLLTLMVVGKGTIPTHDAREFAISKKGLKYRIGDAYVINTFAHNIVGQFMLKFQTPPIPMKLFNDENEAAEWLHSINRV